MVGKRGESDLEARYFFVFLRSRRRAVLRDLGGCWGVRHFERWLVGNVKSRAKLGNLMNRLFLSVKG